MLVSVRRMMQDQLLGSFYMDLAAFALLWLYHALSVAKITKVVKIKSQWFYAHLLVVVVHLLVAVFFNEPSPDSQIQSNQAIKDLPKSEPVVQPYQVGEE
jgi:formate hydrogenlyase subunit 4